MNFNTVYIVYFISWCLRVSIAMTNHHDQNARWEGKGIFNLHFSIDVHH